MLKAINDKIVAEPIEPEKETAGGVLLPETAYDKDHIKVGRVTSVGEGRHAATFESRPLYGNRIAPAVAVGDIIYFRMFSASEIKVGGKLFYVMPEQDILCVKTPAE